MRINFKKAAKGFIFILLHLLFISYAAGSPLILNETFSGSKIPDTFIKHIGDWQVKNGVVRTSGKRPPAGWYLRTRNCYDLERLDFRLKKERRDGTVIIHLKHWMIYLQKDMIDVRLAHSYMWTSYWNTVQRPLDFKAGKWHDFSFILDGNSLRILWDGREIINWSSPKQEWEDRMNKSRLAANSPLKYPKKFPEDAIKGKKCFVVINAYDTVMEMDDIKIFGIDTGKC